jgi:phosphoserine phosphatase RsbU/P
MLGVPLIARGRVVGVTRVQSLTRRKFSEDEVRLLQAIAERAAMAIDNARLYEDLQRSRSEVQAALDTERHFSLLLQRALLPSHVAIGEGYRIAVRYVPAFSSREIGGDFYDAFAVPDGRAGVLVGDVSGKGLEAASLAAATRSTIHAFAHEDWAAADVIGRTNSVLYSEQAETGTFVTVFFVTLVKADGQICYSSAGHPPAAILRADGSVDFLAAVDPPVGVLRCHEYVQHADHLDPGDALVLYTDGISEARSNSTLFDVDGIERTLTGHAEWTCDGIADRLVAAATGYAGGKLVDDAVVLVVARES